MTTTRLTLLVEDNTALLTAKVLLAVHAEERLPAYHRSPEDELLNRFEDVCRTFLQWLDASDDRLLRERYGAVALERFRERIPLAEVVLAAAIFRRILLDYVREQAAPGMQYEDPPGDDWEQLVGKFFDEITYNVAFAYEAALWRMLT